ncbi:MAG: flagellar biosynthesis regulator FlaF [Nitrospirota bacterium]
MHATEIEAYRTVQKTTMSGREIEASVLLSAAMRLKQCQDNWNARDREMRLDEALKFNQLIWTIFQGELAKPDNPLPKKLRQDILSLSAFIDKRIFTAMSYPSPDKLTVLININLNIAAGLRETSK